MSEPKSMLAPRSHRQERILSTVRGIFAQLMGVGAEELDDYTQFVEMGADSLFLLQASQVIQSKFAVKLPFRVMLEEFSTLDLLAAHIDAQLPADEGVHASTTSDVTSSAPHQIPAEEPLPRIEHSTEPIAHGNQVPADNSALERILSQQLQIMARQVELLRHRSNVQSQTQPERTVATPKEPPDEAAPKRIEAAPFVAYKPIRRDRADGLSGIQREHIENLIARLTEKTRGSKRIAATSRATLADNRATAGFRMLWKEMQYPLIADHASGSRLWDIDGNEYVDLTMGFGALLFGHSPSFVVDAVQKQIERGLQLGAESELAGKAAALICELTGVERATFCNSGTEAVMSALRLARTVTGRTKIALFENCYHGTFDGVMVRAGRDADGRNRAVPLAPGVPERMIEDVLLLKLNDPASLEILRSEASTLAAVLVEPMPSRFPDFRPEAFLGELRTITTEAGTALIFDEVITGFRFHPGGAQALFGVRADLVVYGKAAGAGLPVGVVAGKSLYMDAIDGGKWNYGDGSYPRAETTFFAGTYFKHPLTMASVYASLDQMKQRGPALQEELNGRALLLADALNAFFEEESVPARVANFGSLIRFLFDPELKFSELFYYHLLEKGVYICETRSCFLSTAHTERDLDFILGAVKETISEMRAGQLLPLPAREANITQACAPAETSQIPLTDTQKELWLLAQLGDDASRAYNEPVFLRLRGRLDLTAMRNAIQGVVNRHESLRTIFDAGGAFELVLAAVSIDVPLTDLSHLRGEEAERQINELCVREAQQVFDLACGPLIRTRIIKLAEELHLLILTAHAIITDGVSNGILMHEIASLYSAECRRASCSLPEPMQFGEYARQQAQLQSGDQMAEAESYWLAQFAGEFPILDLPTDRPRPLLQSYAGARVRGEIDKAALAALKTLSARHNCTLFTTLLAGFAALLHRLSGQDNVVVMVPVAGQTTTGGKPLVGCCVSLVPFRSFARQDMTFEDFLKSARRTWLDGYSHNIYPINRLIRKLDVPRDPSRPFPISTFFNLDRFEGLTVFGLEAEVVMNPSGSSKFDLDLNITESDEGLVLSLEYNTDLLEAETASQWLSHLVVLLGAAALDPNRRALDLPLLTQFEERSLVVGWNDTAAEYSQQGLCSLFEQQVEKKPDAVALACADEQLSYRELNSRANQLARHLRNVGVQRETIVGVCVERGIEMVVDLLAILKAGGAYLPLDKEYPAERLQYMLKETGTKVVIGGKGVEERFNGSIDRLVLVDAEREEISKQERQNLSEEAEGLNAAYVAFTSGSTGRSKGVVGLHGGALNRLNWMWNTYPFDEYEVCCQKTSLGFLDSFCEIFGPLLQGIPLVIIGDRETKDVGRLLERLAESELSRLVAVPSLLRAMLDLDPELGYHLPNLRLWVTSGEAFSTDLLQRFKTQVPHGRLLNLYGMSEASADTTWSDLGENICEPGRVTIGKPIANTKIYLLDGNMETVPIGVAGEIYVGGVGLARGYLHRPDLTAERFVPDPFSDYPGALLYRTGDLAKWTRDGNIEFLGRLDNQVKIRGFRIEPAEVQAVLNEHGGVKESIVLASRAEPGEKRLMAYVVAREGEELNGNEVRKYLRGKLPDYMVPSAVVVLDAMPLNASKKIDRARLPGGTLAREEMGGGYVEPLTIVERKLAEIWAEALQVDRVGVEDNFFELGGDSILAVQIAINAKHAGLHLTPKDIFEHRTIAQLVDGIEAVSRPQVEQAPVVGPVPLTPIQRWFFEQNLPEPHHFNQAYLLTLERPVDAAILEKAVRELIAHHDALRLRFVQDEQGWRQYDAEPEETVPFTKLDLSEVPDQELSLTIAARCAKLQTSLNLSEGPIIRVELLDLGNGRGARLLIVIHHLAVDVVSWGIILEDLTTACEQLSQGENVSLPAKTTSFKNWAERLEDRARRDEVERELGHWVSKKRQAAENLPLDQENRPNSYASARTITLELEDEKTNELLQETPRAYGTQVSELLLAALGEAVRRWTGARTLLVDIEGHGREETAIEGVDLTRTVGWFTNIYPVAMEVGRNKEDLLKQIKEETRTTEGGLGYGLLRYLGRHEVVNVLRDAPQAEVSFNYLSRFGGAADNFSFSDESLDSIGPSQHPAGRRRYLLEINSILIKGRLRVSFTYSENIHRAATIEALTHDFMDALRSLIDHCVNKSKFSLANVDEHKLNKALEIVKF